jgi:hypothetical protein
MKTAHLDGGETQYMNKYTDCTPSLIGEFS